MLRLVQHPVTVETPGRGLVNLTPRLNRLVADAKVRSGVCTVFCRHTSAGLLIQENADPTAAADLLAWLARLAPDGDPAYRHDAEGPDDMAAHLRTVLSRTSETVPVAEGRLALGTWQAVYLVEHRLAPQRRELLVTVSGL